MISYEQYVLTPPFDMGHPYDLRGGVNSNSRITFHLTRRSTLDPGPPPFGPFWRGEGGSTPLPPQDLFTRGRISISGWSKPCLRKGFHSPRTALHEGIAQKPLLARLLRPPMGSDGPPTAAQITQKTPMIEPKSQMYVWMRSDDLETYQNRSRAVPLA